VSQQLPPPHSAPDEQIVARTDRLVIRRLRHDDFDAFFALCGDPVAMRYMGDGQPLTAEQTRNWIEVSLNNYAERGWGCFAVTPRGSDRLFGFCGFARPADRPGIVELIYAFLPDQWGKGFATEAAHAVIAFGFQQAGMTRIEATVNAENDASKRVLAKVGLVFKKRVTEDDGEVVEYYAVANSVAS
jgi:RimJ/RimL family protein N-acetyltransferase